MSSILRTRLQPNFRLLSFSVQPHQSHHDLPEALISLAQFQPRAPTRRMSSIFGSITSETPKYEVVQKHDAFEIRLYAKQIRAEYTHQLPSSSMKGNMSTSFRTLAGYIFGKNTAHGSDKNEKVAMTAPVMMNMPSEKVAMTAPVMMNTADAAGGDKPALKMAFIMPSKYTLETLPVPKDTNVTLVEVPEHKLAVVTFSGSLSDSSMRKKEVELREAAAKENTKLSDDPKDVFFAGYNPPWCLPWMRKNEVLIAVVDSSQ